MDAVEYLELLLDADRLTVVGLVAWRPHSAAELAERCGLRERDVLTALGPLAQAGVVVAAQGRYRLEPAALTALARSLPQPQPPARTVLSGMTGEEQAVIARFFRGQRLVEIPAARGSDASSSNAWPSTSNRVSATRRRRSTSTCAPTTTTTRRCGVIWSTRASSTVAAASTGVQGAGSTNLRPVLAGEARMVSVIPGCEAWSADGGDVGALVLHGFLGNPSSVRPLGERLAERGFSVELPRLPGHGTRWQDLQRTRWPDWTREADAALALLAARTRVRVAVGLSGGALLALHLAQTRGNDLDGLVLINPVIHYRAANPVLYLVPVLQWFLPALPGIGNDIAKPGCDELPYRRLPLKAVAQGLLLERRVRAGLASVSAPTLVFTCRQDHVVDPGDSTRVLEGISSSDTEQVWLERSYHVATLDYDADVIGNRTVAFLEHLAARAPAGRPAAASRDR